MSPSLPPTAPVPAFGDASAQVGSFAKKGTGYGQAWVDPAGPDPAHFGGGQRRRLALPSGDELRQGGGGVGRRLVQSPGALVQSEGPAVIVLLGAPLGCCDAPRLEAQPTMLRLSGVAEGEMTLDGRFESKQSP